MLVALKVKDFAIIDSLELEFEAGLNIVSGETGAGKSVLLKSLALLMGEQGSAKDVRSGASAATIEGLFDLSDRPDISKRLLELSIEGAESEMLVRRTLSPQGKNKIYINGSLSTLNDLREIVAPLITVTGQGAPLIEMTGQHDNRHLQSKTYHLDILDMYTGAIKKRQHYVTSFERLKEVKSEIQRLSEESRTREQRLDFLRFQRDEIHAANLKPGDEEALERGVARLKNVERLLHFCQGLEDTLYADDDSVLVRLKSLLTKSGEISAIDPEIGVRLEGLTSVPALIEEAVFQVRDYAQSLESDPEKLSELEESLSQFRKLQKKYGSSVDEILNFAAQLEKEIESLEGNETTLSELQSEQEQLEKDLSGIAEDLHKRRLEGAKLLGKSVNAELLDLNMKGVTLLVSVQRLESLNSAGISDVELMIQSGSTDHPRPLAKYASGGELSRILLAIKRVIGLSDYPRTYLFDEVDTGVSGNTAEKVGRKLKSIAEGQQVLCVTHLAQVAAFADAHYLIVKDADKKGVTMRVQRLEKKERISEIARLISGEKITKTSLDHAKQLLGL